jgi:hypothetical protein
MGRIRNYDLDENPSPEDLFLISKGEDGSTANIALSQIEYYTRNFSSIESKVDFTISEPALITEGVKYLSTVTGISSITGTAVTADRIYRGTGGLWIETPRIEGWKIWDKDLDLNYTFNGTAWITDSIGGGGGVTDHTLLTNIGTKTHATLDSEVAANNAKISFDSTSSTRLANTSGTNTGDQTIPVTGVDFDPVGTDNSNNNAVNTLYSGLVSNVSTALSVGTNNTTQLSITSDGGADDVTLPLATSLLSGIINSATYDDIVSNTAKISFDSTSSTRLANTSGTNTGDQTIPVTGVDFDPVGTDNSDNNAVNTLYSGLAGSKQDNISLTTTGTSGAATLVGATLNIPQYAGGGAAASDLVYSALWNANTDAASKNAIYDKIESVIAGVGTGATPVVRVSAAETTWNVGSAITASHKLYVDGTKMVEGADYTQTGSTFTFTGYVATTSDIQEYYPDIAVPANGLLSTDIDTLAELNAIITDATLIDTADARLSDARTPLAHTHSLTTDVTGILPVANGGTGLTSLSTLLNSNVTPTTLGLGNVTNESKATMFTSPTFTGTVVTPSAITMGANTVTRSGAHNVTLTTTATTALTLPVSGTVYSTGTTDVSIADGGTGRSTGTTAFALVATGTTATGAQQTLAQGTTAQILVGNGAALPVWTTATGTGSPVRATSPTLVTPSLGVATATSINGATITSGTLNGSVTGTNTGDQVASSGTGTVISLTNPLGYYGDMTTANTATTYTTTGTTLGAFAVIRINAATQPAITGATLLTGATFAASTDMHMVVQYFGVTVQFYFIAL